MYNEENPLVPADVEAMALEEHLENTFLPPEDQAEMERQGEFYADALRAAEYCLEGGSPIDAADDIRAVHPGFAIPADELHSHPAHVVGKELSDLYNSSRISNRREPPAKRDLRY